MPGLSQPAGRVACSGAGCGHKCFHDTVIDYLKEELANHDETERDPVVRLAEELIAEEPA